MTENLGLDLELWKMAQKHANDLGKSGLSNHSGTTGLNLSERAKEYCIQVPVYENLSFGNYETPQECILNLLIDDGVKSRIHRDNLFRSNIAHVGIGFSTHKVYDFCYVVDYWESYAIEVEEEEEEEDETEPDEHGKDFHGLR